MPLMEAGGLRQYFRLDGQNDRPVLIFSHSLGCDHTQWDAQAAAMLPHFRVLRYDIRGHGATGVPSGDYSIEMLGRDVLALADALGIGQFAWSGLSLGGMIGQWLGANAPSRVTALILANTSSCFPDPSLMETRRRTALESGMAALEASVMGASARRLRRAGRFDRRAGNTGGAGRFPSGACVYSGSLKRRRRNISAAPR